MHAREGADADEGGAVRRELGQTIEQKDQNGLVEKVVLKPNRGVVLASRPGQRHYVPAKDVPKVRNGLGIAIISTSQGVMTDKEARTKGVGGEVLCEVW